MIRFISYGKGISIFLIVFIHIFLAYFNANDLWAGVANSPVIENRSYPKVIELINDYFYVKLFGFLVAGSVCFFFLSSGFTFFKSKEKRNFSAFWMNKLKRLVPFYYFILIFNISISLIASYFFNIENKHSVSDYLWQLLIGIQYFVPNGVVLDLVVWFLGVLLFFYFLASVVFRKFTLVELVIFDLLCIFIALISKIMIVNGGGILSIDNYIFIIKSCCFSLLIVNSLLLSLHYYGKFSRNITAYLLILQVLIFMLIYRFNAEYVNYIHLDDYFVWFLFYIVLFVYLFSINKNIREIRVLDFLDRISFSLYLSHGVLGYFVLSILLDNGFNKTLSCFITLFMTILVSYFLNKYIEGSINKFVK